MHPKISNERKIQIEDIDRQTKEFFAKSSEKKSANKLTSLAKASKKIVDSIELKR